MVRRDARDPDVRSFEAVLDASDLRSVLSTALAARPIDEDALRRGVWTYVENERQAGGSPVVSGAVTSLRNQIETAPASATGR